MFKEVIKSILPAFLVGIALAVLWRYCEKELIDYVAKSGAMMLKVELFILSMSLYVHLISFVPLFFNFLSWKERMYLSLPISMVTMFSIGGPFATIIVATICSYKLAKQYRDESTESL